MFSTDANRMHSTQIIDLFIWLESL